MERTTLVEYINNQPSGTQGYLLNRNAAKKLLLHTDRMIHPIDDAIDRAWEHRLRLRGIEPAILSLPNIYESTIGDRSRSITTRQKLLREFYRLPSSIWKLLWRLRKTLRGFIGKPHLFLFKI